MRSLGPGSATQFQIPYETERGVEYVLCNSIATIIDYGFSHIVVPEIKNTDGTVLFPSTHLGKSDFVKVFPVYPDSSWVLGDIYHFILASLYFLSPRKPDRNNPKDKGSAGNPAVIAEISKIMRFFNASETFTEFVRLTASGTHGNIGYYLPLTPETEKLTLDMFANYIRQVSNVPVGSRDTTYPVLNCEQMCLAEDIVYADLGINGVIHVPKNVVEFYDVETQLRNQVQVDASQRLMNSFDFSGAFIKHIVAMNQKVAEINALSTNMVIVNLNIIPLNLLSSVNTLNQVRKMYTDCASLIDKVAQYNFYPEAGVYVANLVGNESVVDTIGAMSVTVRDLSSAKITQCLDVMSHNLSKYVRLAKNSVISPPLGWYGNDRVMFDRALGLQG